MRHIPKFFCLLFCALALSNTAFCQADFSPFLARSAHFIFIDEHIVNISHGSAQNLALNITLPANSKIISSSKPYEISSDGLNTYILHKDQNPQMPYFVKTALSISTNATEVNSTPALGDLNSSFLLYLAPTKYVPSNDAQVRLLAESITSNYSSDFEKISALAIWANSAIEYDLDYAQKNRTYYQILQDKKGVCGDYTILFITLCRSLGYPARFVSGYAYSDLQKEWMGHSWAEAYAGEWISADPTWLEVGNVDATHIRLITDSSTNYKLASVSALVQPADAQISWQGQPSQNSPIDNLDLNSLELSPPISNYEIMLSSSQVAPSSRFLAYLKYPDDGYYVADASLLSCKSEGWQIFQIGNESKALIAEKGKEKYAIWEINSTPNAEDNMIYNCPLLLNSRLLENRPVEVSLSKTFSWHEGSADVEQSIIPPGGRQKIFATFSKELAGQQAFALEQNMLKNCTLDSNGYCEFEFEASGIGRHEIYVFTSGADPLKLEYLVDLGFGGKAFNISFERLKYAGDSGEAILYFDPAALSKYYGSLMVYSWPGQSEQIAFSPSNSTSIKLPIKALFAKSSTFAVSLISQNGDLIYRQTEPFEISEKTRVWIAKIDIMNLNANQTLAKLIVDSNGPVGLIYLTINGEKYSLSKESEFNLRLDKKEYYGKLVWADSSGALSEAPFYIRTPSEEDPTVLDPGIMVTFKQASYASLLFQSAIAFVLLAVAWLLWKRIFAKKQALQ